MEIVNQNATSEIRTDWEMIIRLPDKLVEALTKHSGGVIFHPESDSDGMRVEVTDLHDNPIEPIVTLYPSGQEGVGWEMGWDDE